MADSADRPRCGTFSTLRSPHRAMKPLFAPVLGLLTLFVAAAPPAAAQESLADRVERRVERVGERLGAALERIPERLERSAQRLEARLTQPEVREAERQELEAQREQERLDRQARADERAARRAEAREERDRLRRERAEARAARRPGNDDGARILFAKSYALREGETISEEIVVIAGTAVVDGHAEGDVTVLGGTLRLGPKAVVDGEVNVVGGRFITTPTSVVHGGVEHVSFSGLSGWWDDEPWFGPMDSRAWAGVGLAFTLGRFAMMLLVSLGLALFTPGFVSRVAGRADDAPGWSIVSGFASQILFVPLLICLVIALTVSIVGIPLLLAIPLVLAAAMLMWIGGYGAVAGLVGARVRGVQRPYVSATDVLLGSFVLIAPTIVGQVLALGPGWMSPFAWMLSGTGFVIEYLAWTIALGASISGGGRRWDAGGVVPPAVPPPLPAV